MTGFQMKSTQIPAKTEYRRNWGGAKLHAEMCGKLWTELTWRDFIWNLRILGGTKSNPEMCGKWSCGWKSARGALGTGNSYCSRSMLPCKANLATVKRLLNCFKTFFFASHVSNGIHCRQASLATSRSKSAQPFSRCSGLAAATNCFNPSVVMSGIEKNTAQD